MGLDIVSPEVHCCASPDLTLGHVTGYNLQCAALFQLWKTLHSTCFSPSCSPCHRHLWHVWSLFVSARPGVSVIYCILGSLLSGRALYPDPQLNCVFICTPNTPGDGGEWQPLEGLKSFSRGGCPRGSGLEESMLCANLLAHFGWKLRELIVVPQALVGDIFFPSLANRCTLQSTDKKAKHLKVWRAKNIWRLVFKNTLSFQKA